MSDTAWALVYSRQAQKDAKKLASSGLKKKALDLLDILAEDPFATPPRYEKLVGDLAGCYSRRINIQHRLVYEVLPDERVVHVLRCGPTTSRACPRPPTRVGRARGAAPQPRPRKTGT